MLRGSGSLREAFSDISSRPAWSDRFEELTSYAVNHGDCNVPKAAGPLGRWVARQRELARKGGLTQERRASLDGLGFVWNTNEAAWETRFNELLQWVQTEGADAKRGRACVPIASGDLGVWVAKQRQLRRKKKLSAERERRLNTLGFVWDTAAADWEEKFQALLEWKHANNGDTRVPFNSSGDGLGWWVATQRQTLRKGKISAERRERLDSIGFCWNPADIPRRGRIFSYKLPRGSSQGASHFHVNEDAPPQVPVERGHLASPTQNLSQLMPRQSSQQPSPPYPDGGHVLPDQHGHRRHSNKRRHNEGPQSSNKRHHSFSGELSPYGPASGGSPSANSTHSEPRAWSCGPLAMSGDPFSVPQPGPGSGSTTPGSGRAFSATGSGLELGGNAVGYGEVHLAPLLDAETSQPAPPPSSTIPGTVLPPISSLSPLTPPTAGYVPRSSEPYYRRGPSASLGPSQNQHWVDQLHNQQIQISSNQPPHVKFDGRVYNPSLDTQPGAGGTSWATRPVPEDTSETGFGIAGLALSSDQGSVAESSEDGDHQQPPVSGSPGPLPSIQSLFQPGRGGE